MLGMFFYGGGKYNAEDTDQSDGLFVSFNGKDFFLLNYAFEDIDKNSNSENRVRPAWDEGSQYVWALHDPTLTYAKGMYWSMSGYSPEGGGFYPMIAASKDLVNWSYPNNGLSKSLQVKSGQTLPYGKDGKRDNKNWDLVAPEMIFDGDDAYIVVSLGYWAAYHGDSGINDKMSLYLVKAGDLTPGSQNPTVKSEKDKMPKANWGELIPINLPDGCNDRIDASFYKEGNKFYLVVKRNGIINEIWSIDSLSKVSNKKAWTLVRDTVSEGTEGPTLTKFQGRYYMYSDKLMDYPSGNLRNRGIVVSTSPKLESGWTTQVDCTFKDWKGKDLGGQRHGSVLTVTDPNEIAKIMAIYNSKYSSVPSTTPYQGSKEAEKHSPSKADISIWLTGFYFEKNMAYWYEKGHRQGVYGSKGNVWYDGTERGREIYDSGTDGWYWLDAVYDGAKAVDKEVFMPYIYQDEDTFNQEQLDKAVNESNTYTESSTTANMGEQVKYAIENKLGKWVRYDSNGKMYKGWYTVEGRDASIYPNQVGNTYYYDYKTGLMAKGYTIIDGRTYYFDPITGVLQ